MKILVIDDSATIRAALKVGIHGASQGDFSVIEAGGGMEGLVMYKKHEPDVIILDVVMPDLNGLEVARRIRDIEEGKFLVSGVPTWTPIVFLTSLENDDEIEKCLLAGGDDFMTKPASNIVLTAKLRAIKRTIELRKKLKESLQRAERDASIDGLTGLKIRRAFDEILVREVSRTQRSGDPASLILLDIDHFKKYNDTYGHLAGDTVLASVSAVFNSCAQRGGDFAFRYGGEEFAIILTETPIISAVAVANDILAKIAKLSIPHRDGKNGIVSVSMGVAQTIGKVSTGPSLIAEADIFLYESKRSGRGRVSCGVQLLPKAA